MLDKAKKILQSRLLKNFYSRFSVGDTFDLFFDGFMIVSQEIHSNDEALLNSFLEDQYTPYQVAIDKENVPKSTILTTTLRKEIINVELLNNGELHLYFENGIHLRFPVDTDIVDWQWALNKNGNDPNWKDGYEVCCFFENDIRVYDY